MRRSLLSTMTLSYFLMSDSMPQSQVQAYFVWWQPWTWVEQALVLTFKLVAKGLEKISFAGRLKQRLRTDLQDNIDHFVDERALHGVSK